MTGRIVLVIALGLVIAPSALAAQGAPSATPSGIRHTPGSAPPPSVPPPPPSPPTPSSTGFTGLTLPIVPAGGLVGASGRLRDLAPPPGGRMSPRSPDLYGARGRYNRLLSRREQFAGVPIGFGGGYGYEVAASDDTRGQARIEVAAGYLGLVMQPGTAQVFVDRLYVGTVADLSAGLLLEAGPHRVEVSAPGYDTLTFDVRVPENDLVIYRRDLERTVSRPQAPATPPAPRVAKTFYVIPNCYAGDKKPQGALLPSGCDARNVREVSPTVSVARRSGGK